MTVLRHRARTWLSVRRAHLDDRGSGAGAVIIFTLVFLSLSARASAIAAAMPPMPPPMIPMRISTPCVQ